MFEKFTYLSLCHGAIPTSNKDRKKKKDIVTMYPNCSKDLVDISMDGYFYKHFYKEVLKENGDHTETTNHRILLLVGQNCNPSYPVPHDYAKGVLIQYKHWSKDKPLTKILKSGTKTICAFKRMMDKKQ